MKFELSDANQQTGPAGVAATRTLIYRKSASLDRSANRGFAPSGRPLLAVRVMKETFRATSKVIACTLSADELQDTEAAWQRLLHLSLISREVVPGGLHLVLHSGSAASLRQLVDIERDCCRWITFVVDGASVTMTAAGLGAVAIRQMWKVRS